MKNCDINCDMGEGIGNDSVLMQFITSANIACGYHAGDINTINETILLAKQHSVNIGAHPSFLDLANFGRTEMNISPEEIYQIVTEQIALVNDIAEKNGASLHHVKPHGALYNMAARDMDLAKTIAQAIKDFNPLLKLYGLSGSFLISEGKSLGLTTVSEVFADRTYQDDGSLTPRNHPNALIKDTGVAIQQVLTMIKEGYVTSTSGEKIPIEAATVCIHGDGEFAVLFAKEIKQTLNFS